MREKIGDKPLTSYLTEGEYLETVQAAERESMTWAAFARHLAISYARQRFKLLIAADTYPKSNRGGRLPHKVYAKPSDRQKIKDYCKAVGWKQSAYIRVVLLKFARGDIVFFPLAPTTNLEEITPLTENPQGGDF